MDMTRLKLEFDPDWQCDPYQEALSAAPEPRFRYTWQGISVLGLCFKFERKHTGGFDPYAGDEWSLDVLRKSFRSPFLHLQVSNLVIWTAELEVRPLKLIDAVYVKTGFPWGWWRISEKFFPCWKIFDVREYRFRDLPWFVRKLWDFLEYRREWWEAHAEWPEEERCTGT